MYLWWWLLGLVIPGSADEDRREVFVHVGPHKTGSSHMQSLLFKSRHDLVPLNISFPTGFWEGEDHILSSTGAFPHKEHCLLVEAMRKNYTKVLANFQTIVARLPRKMKIVLSSECFDVDTEEMLSALKKLLPKSDIRVFAVWRDFVTLFLSNYEQVVSERFNRQWCQGLENYFPASRWLASRLEVPIQSSSRIATQRVLDESARVVGRDNVYILDLQGAKHASIDQVEVFLKIVGAPNYYSESVNGNRDNKNSQNRRLAKWTSRASEFRLAFQHWLIAHGKLDDKFNPKIACLCLPLQFAQHVPLRCSNVHASPMLLSNVFDRNMLAAYKDRILYHDHAATPLAIDARDSLCELDVQALLRWSELRDHFEREYIRLQEVDGNCPPCPHDNTDRPIPYLIRDFPLNRVGWEPCHWPAWVV